MAKLQIVDTGRPDKGNMIGDQMSELSQSSDGMAGMAIVWEHIFRRKRAFFIFQNDVVTAKNATDEDVKKCAKAGGFGMGGSKLPFPGLIGLAVKLTAGAIGAAAHTGAGMRGIMIQYNNAQGYNGSVMVIGDDQTINEIIKSIPAEKMHQ